MIVIFMMIMLLNIMMMIMIAKTHGFDYGTDDDNNNRHKNHLREFVCETHVILAQAREEGEPKRPTARGG